MRSIESKRLQCPSCGEPFPLRRLYRFGWRKECPSCGAGLKVEPRSGARIGAAIGLAGGVLLVVVGPERLLDWRWLATVFVASAILTSCLLLRYGSLVPVEDADDADVVRAVKMWWPLSLGGLAVQVLVGAVMRVWPPTEPKAIVAMIGVYLVGALATILAMVLALFGRGGILRRQTARPDQTPPSAVASGDQA
jgi:uncharacterized paraquat-inducible protein A